MKNIIKSQLYQLKKNKIFFVIFVLLVVVECTNMFGEMNFMMDGAKMTAGGYLAENGTYVIGMAVVFALLITGEICGADFLDKTTNYEMMGGHLRRDVYFGRAVLSLIIGTIGTMLISIVPLIAAGVIGGFGDEVSLEGVVLRYVLVIFPVLRLICEFIFLSYIVKNAYIIMALGLVCGLSGDSFLQLFKQGNMLCSGFGTMYKAFDFPVWSTFTLVDEKIINLYDSAVPVGSAAGIIGSSLLIGGLFLVLGYLFFARDDLN